MDKTEEDDNNSTEIILRPADKEEVRSATISVRSFSFCCMNSSFTRKNTRTVAMQKKEYDFMAKKFYNKKDTD